MTMYIKIFREKFVIDNLCDVEETHGEIPNGMMLKIKHDTQSLEEFSLSLKHHDQ
jgi:hypothetical protein